MTVTSASCPFELCGAAFARVDGVDRFWAVRAGALVGWSPSAPPLEVPAPGAGQGARSCVAVGATRVAALLEGRDRAGERTRRVVVVDARDGRVLAERGWGRGGDSERGAGAVPGVAISSTGETVAHGDGRSLLVWRVSAPRVDWAPAIRGTPRWVCDDLDCLVDEGSRWRFAELARGTTTEVKLANVPRDASWTLAADLSVATSREGHRALIVRDDAALHVELSALGGRLAAGPGGRVAALCARPDRSEETLSVIDRAGRRTVLARERGGAWRALAFSSDGSRLAVLRARRVAIHAVPA